MDNYKLYVLLMSVFSSLFFILIIVFKLFNIGLFLNIIVYFFLLFFGFLYLSKSFLDDEVLFEKNKKNILYAFKRVNEILKSKSGSTHLSWNKGFSFESQFKSLYVSKDGKSHYFRSFIGDIEDENKTFSKKVLIIYDVDLDDIVKYKPDPSQRELEDHFYNFNPSGGSFVSHNNFYRKDDFPPPSNVVVPQSVDDKNNIVIDEEKGGVGGGFE